MRYYEKMLSDMDIFIYIYIYIVVKLRVVVNKRKKFQGKKTWTRTIIIKILYRAVVHVATRGV